MREREREGGGGGRDRSERSELVHCNYEKDRGK